VRLQEIGVFFKVLCRRLLTPLALFEVALFGLLALQLVLHEKRVLSHD
jgi:hypothetical protein